MLVNNKRLQRKLKTLSKIANCTDLEKRCKLLENADNATIACIIECIANVLYDRFHIKAKEKRELEKFATSIRKLSKIRSYSAAREELVQEGAGIFLPLLLEPILTAAAAVIGHYL